MSDKMRWRYGEKNEVEVAVAAATAIEIGDLVFRDDDGSPKPASMQADQGSEQANQRWFAERFWGVAMRRSKSGETAPIKLATTGVFEFDCPSDYFEMDELVGVDENAAGIALLNQQVTKVREGCAVGRVAKREATPKTLVLVQIQSHVAV